MFEIITNYVMRSSAGSQITDVFLGIKLDSCCRSACEFSLDMANFLLQVLGIIRCFGAVIHFQKNGLMKIAECSVWPKISSRFLTQGRFNVPRL